MKRTAQILALSVRVLVTLAGTFGRTDGLPVAGNARLERFVPHRAVLERAAAVVCHAGMGIVHKAISAAVPIVAVPFGRDQPEVARRVVESGAGVALSANRLSPTLAAAGLPRVDLSGALGPGRVRAAPRRGRPGALRGRGRGASGLCANLPAVTARSRWRRTR